MDSNLYITKKVADLKAEILGSPDAYSSPLDAYWTIRKIREALGHFILRSKNNGQ